MPDANDHRRTTNRHKRRVTSLMPRCFSARAVSLASVPSPRPSIDVRGIAVSRAKQHVTAADEYQIRGTVLFLFHISLRGEGAAHVECGRSGVCGPTFFMVEAGTRVSSMPLSATTSPLASAMAME